MINSELSNEITDLLSTNNKNSVLKDLEKLFKKYYRKIKSLTLNFSSEYNDEGGSEASLYLWSASDESDNIIKLNELSEEIINENINSDYLKKLWELGEIDFFTNEQELNYYKNIHSDIRNFAIWDLDDKFNSQLYKIVNNLKEDECWSLDNKVNYLSDIEECTVEDLKKIIFDSENNRLS